MRKLILAGALGLLFAGSSMAFAASPSFDRDLKFGMRGNADVTDLQEFLTETGYYTGPITGNYFLLTTKAVKSFQSANGIRSNGMYFGPLTRAAANKILEALG